MGIMDRHQCLFLQFLQLTCLFLVILPLDCYVLTNHRFLQLTRVSGHSDLCISRMELEFILGSRHFFPAQSPLRSYPERTGSKWEAHFPVCSWSAENPCWGALGQVTGDRPSSAS